MKRRKQNHKISFHFFSGSPHTPRRKWIGKEIFGFGSRPKGARGAHCSLHHAIRAYDLVSSPHALRACEVNQNPADFAHTMFELRPENTAKARSAKMAFRVASRHADPRPFGRKSNLAEARGFEPLVPQARLQFSRLVHSTTLPRLR